MYQTEFLKQFNYLFKMSLLVLNILESFLGEPKKHNIENGQVSFDCPACGIDKDMPDGDGKGNLEINYNEGVFKCWSCYQKNDMSGKIPKLIKMFGTSKLLKDYYLIEPTAISSYNKKDVEFIEVLLPETFTKISKSNKKDLEYNNALTYLQSRNISMDIIERYDIGYGIKGSEAGRVILPSYDKENILNYYTGRSYKKYVKPKYLNPEVDKSVIIFNERFLNWNSTIYIVEGPFDHIILPNSIPLLGKYLSETLLMKILENANADIVLVLDGDALSDSYYLYKKLNILNLYGKIKFVELPYGRDISEIYQYLGKKGVVSYLRLCKDISEFKNNINIKLKFNC